MELVGTVFTNADYAIRKEGNCFAYKITEVIDDYVYAIALKLTVVSEPSRLKLNGLSSCGRQRLEYPLCEVGGIELFKLTTFGLRKCIMNKSKCLIELANDIRVEQNTTNHSSFDELTSKLNWLINRINSGCGLYQLTDYNQNNDNNQDSFDNLILKLEWLVDEVIRVEQDKLSKVEWMTCSQYAHTTVYHEMSRLNKLKQSKQEEINALYFKLSQLQLESQESCSHKIKTIELANLNCCVKYCSVCHKKWTIK